MVKSSQRETTKKPTRNICISLHAALEHVSVGFENSHTFGQRQPSSALTAKEEKSLQPLRYRRLISSLFLSIYFYNVFLPNRPRFVRCLPFLSEIPTRSHPP